ncbi:hypothetical protein [Alicyclobacillus sp. SO9]|uniref:hypothetical protein n=1 Tax=Alicyclobacillus sp. SO9 TaxID=2665646 RepID=UPI0018E84843|nr:hypothetical protein [Alicyclobacillus sp. SO9]
MDEETTRWACTHCHADGNLLSLLQIASFKSARIEHGYNPERQRRDIQTMFLHAINDGQMNQQRLRCLYEKTMALIHYYRNS